ncbi:MAG: hypothetical protein JSR85_07290 [Proteobacteria bacterium]|nr:hypothetical protein [Pseudomonadota bacterium]
MNKKIFGFAFFLAAILETTFLNAMPEVESSGIRSTTPPPLSMYDQGWAPGAPCRTEKDRASAQARAKADPSHYRWFNGNLWIRS